MLAVHEGVWRVRFVAVWVLAPFLLIGCGGAAQPGASPSSPDRLAQCPELPEAWVSIDDSKVWPAATVGDLVPEFAGSCATPTAPLLFGQLSESVAMSGSVEAAALGVLHEGREAVATFSATRLAGDVPGLDEGVGASGGKVTSVSELELAWGRSGSHVTVFWLDGHDLVTIAAAGPDLVADAATRWLNATGVDDHVTAPEPIPEISPLPPALAQGLPVDGFPSERFVTLPVDPIVFLGADIADAVTIFDEPLESVGAAIILTKDGTLVATAIGWKGTVDGVATAPKDLADEIGDTPANGHVAASITTGDLDILLVGHDDTVNDLARAWSQNVDQQ